MATWLIRKVTYLHRYRKLYKYTFIYCGFFFFFLVWADFGGFSLSTSLTFYLIFKIHNEYALFPIIRKKQKYKAQNYGGKILLFIPGAHLWWVVVRIPCGVFQHRHFCLLAPPSPVLLIEYLRPHLELIQLWQHSVRGIWRRPYPLWTPVHHLNYALIGEVRQLVGPCNHLLPVFDGWVQWRSHQGGN